MVMVATSPPTVMAPNKVRVCQWPAGAPSGTRSPRRPRPHRRVICVVTPLSSRNTSHWGSIWLISSHHACRRRRPSSVSCSWAWRDFFSPQSQLLHHVSPQAAAYAYSSGFQLLAQLRQAQIRLLPQPAPQTLLHRFRGSNLLAVPPTHPELRGQLPQASRARFISLQKLAP